MPFATSRKGIRIHFEVREPARAHGDTVVLLQGLGLSSKFWFDQPEILMKDRDAPRRVVTLDNRGTGRSDRPRGPYTMAQMADDVAAVLDASETRRAIIVGISMGGMIAQRVAIRHPERVAGLVLLATSGGLPHAVFPKPQAIATLFTMPLVARGGKRPRRAVRRYNRLLLPERELDRANEHFARWPAALAEHPLTVSTFLNQFFAVATNWTGSHLSRISCPTIVVAGAEDILVPPNNSRRIADVIPGAKLEVLPDIAHAIPMLDPAVVTRSLRSLDAS